MNEFLKTGLKASPFSKKVYFLSAMLLSALVVAGCEAPPPPPPPPVENLVIIGIDTVGSDVFFSELINDALSARLEDAQQYRNASSVAPWTIPAVASTLTGLYPFQHSAGQFQKQPANLDVDLPSPLDESAVSLADMLNEQQFKTGAFSAHPWINAKFGLAQGFKQLHARKGWQQVTSKFYDWLDETKQQQPSPRFFGYLHFMEAHDWHLKSRAEKIERLADADPALRAQLLEDSSSAACVDENHNICLSNQVYNLAVLELRGAIADILQNLEDRDLLKNTMVVVYSDHGEEFWEHKTEHEQRGDPRGIYGFGHGQSLYQELLHVPLLVWHPGINGAIRQDLVSLIDVVPSSLNWLGIEQTGQPLPGIAMPAGMDKTPDSANPRTIYASGISYGPEAIAAREGQLKSIMHYPDESFEYFDLEKDPKEKRPTQGDQLTMRFDVLTGDYVDMKNNSLASSPELDAQTLEHLKSIGYLQGVEEQPAPEAKKAPVKDSIPDDGSNNPDPEDH